MVETFVSIIKKISQGKKLSCSKEVTSCDFERTKLKPFTYFVECTDWFYAMQGIIRNAKEMGSVKDKP